MGFADHDDDDDLGLVNMRGRVYDPKIGRFITPDVFVPSPHFTQSHNRYSYALNSPLVYVDPSGFDDTLPPYTDQELRECTTPDCAKTGRVSFVELVIT